IDSRLGDRCRAFAQTPWRQSSNTRACSSGGFGVQILALLNYTPHARLTLSDSSNKSPLVISIQKLCRACMREAKDVKAFRRTLFRGFANGDALRVVGVGPEHDFRTGSG